MNTETTYRFRRDGESICSASLKWTDETKLALTQAVIANGKLLMPAGVNKHFHMIEINRRFHTATKERVDTKVLWDKLNDFFDLAEVESIINCPFPNEQTEFSLPENEFDKILIDRKSQSSQDKMDDGEGSRDSASGLKTSPIANRGTGAVFSTMATAWTTKQRYLSSSSDTGSESITDGDSRPCTPVKLNADVKMKKLFRE